MSDETGPMKGVFEGYLKKHKNVNSLTLFIEYNKRYFCLDSGKFKLVYYKNRKKTGAPSEIPLNELLSVRLKDYTDFKVSHFEI